MATVKATARHLISMKEAAQIVGCTTQTIRNWVSEGRLSAFRIGERLVRVDQDELDALIRKIPAVVRVSAA